MFITAIKTRRLLPPQDDLLSALRGAFLHQPIKEKSIIAITSKVVSIWEGQCIKINSEMKKDDLVKQEADFYLKREEAPKGYAMLTIKNNILIPTAGIDESNADGHYILWPKNPKESAKALHRFFCEEYNIKDMGIIITDSHCVPQRQGTMGIALAYYGFLPTKDYRKATDIFGREIKMSILNIADSLAVASVLAMGEGAEQTPVAVIEDANVVVFKNNATENDPLIIKADDDIYAPLLKNIKWLQKEDK